MPNNELGKLRRSAVIMNYGPGAIIDFRAGRKGGTGVRCFSRTGPMG